MGMDGIASTRQRNIFFLLGICRMDDLKDKVVRIYDHGQFQSLASRLARDFGRVEYFKPWKKTAPQFRSLLLGSGFPEVHRVRDFFKGLENVDLVVFPDVYDGDLQLFLEKQGIRVWGSRDAEQFEFMRTAFKRIVKEVGLPVGEYHVVNGIHELKDFFQEHGDDKWVVKINLLRGDGETWKWDNKVIGQSMLRSMDSYYAEAGDEIVFVVERQIDSIVEPGYDGFTIDGQFTNGFIDYEIKNKLTAAAFCDYSDLSPYVQNVNRAFSDKLKEVRARTMWGTEMLVDEQGECFFIDATARMPSPPGELMLEMVDNISTLMWRGSVGEFVQAEATKQFGVELMLYANWQELPLLPIVIPDDVKQWVKLSSSCQIKGNAYAIQYCGDERIPWLEESVAAVTGVGDSLEEAYENAMEYAEQVEGANLNITGHEIAEAIERINEGKKEGVEFPGEIPREEIAL